MPSWKRVIVSGSSAHLNEITGSGGIHLPDSAKLTLGDAQDLKIYHGGSNSIIQEGGAGGLIIRASTLTLLADNTSENFVICTENAGVDLYYNGVKKLETVSGGVTVTGTLAATTLTGAHANADSAVQPADTFYIGTTSVAHNRGSGALTLAGITLTTPTIASFANSTHDHADAAGGGVIALGTATSGNYVEKVTVGTGLGGAVDSEGGTAAMTLDAAQTVITSVVNSGLEIGKDADNRIKFGTDNQIIFEVDTGDNVIFKTAGEIEATSLDISGGVDIAGAITSAEWTGDVIASAYLDADTAHLSTTQTFSGAKSFTLAVNIDATTAASSKTTGALIVDGGVGVALDVHAGGDVVAYASSDERLKDNLQVIQDPLDKVGQISGYEFDWNEESPEWAQERGHDIGIVAQEIQKVLPEIVTERTNGYLGVDYKRIIPLLIESVKELKQEIENLKKKVN
jgi:hypothetical protein